MDSGGLEDDRSMVVRGGRLWWWKMEVKGLEDTKAGWWGYGG